MDDYLQAYHYDIIIKGIKKEDSMACSLHFALSTFPELQIETAVA